MRRLLGKLTPFLCSYLIVVLLVFTTSSLFGRIVIIIVIAGLYAFLFWAEYRIMLLEDKLSPTEEPAKPSL